MAMNNCDLCDGQMGIYATCGICRQTIEYLCTKCQNSKKEPCSCFDVRSRFDFL